MYRWGWPGGAAEHIHTHTLAHTHIQQASERAGGLGDACKSPEALAGNYRGGSKMWVGGLPGEMVDGYTVEKKERKFAYTHTYTHISPTQTSSSSGGGSTAAPSRTHTHIYAYVHKT